MPQGAAPASAQERSPPLAHGGLETAQSTARVSGDLETAQSTSPVHAASPPPDLAPATHIDLVEDHAMRKPGEETGNQEVSATVAAVHSDSPGSVQRRAEEAEEMEYLALVLLSEEMPCTTLSGSEMPCATSGSEAPGNDAVCHAGPGQGSGSGDGVLGGGGGCCTEAGAGGDCRGDGAVAERGGTEAAGDGVLHQTMEIVSGQEGIGRGGGADRGSAHAEGVLHQTISNQETATTHMDGSGDSERGNVRGAMDQQASAAQQTVFQSRERAGPVRSGGVAVAGHASGVDAGGRCGGTLNPGGETLNPGGEAADSKDTGSGDRYEVAEVVSSGGERGSAKVVVLKLSHAATGATREVPTREFFIDNLLVRIHLIIEMVFSRPALRHGSLDFLFQEHLKDGTL